jgi:thioredoxin reductase (NADPH)
VSEIRAVAIIDSGPAGYTAALYTARAQFKPLLFGSSIFIGGQADKEASPDLPA